MAHVATDETICIPAKSFVNELYGHFRPKNLVILLDKEYVVLGLGDSESTLLPKGTQMTIFGKATEILMYCTIGTKQRSFTKDGKIVVKDTNRRRGTTLQVGRPRPSSGSFRY